MPSMRVFIEAAADGVYLNIKNPIDNTVLLRETIYKTIEEYKLKDVDREAVDRLINGFGSVRREKLSDEIIIASKAVDEAVFVETSSDALRGYIYFTPPEGNGRRLTEDDVLKFLKIKGIVHGVDTDSLNYIISMKRYNEKYLIASGNAPENGKDGKMEILFDNSHMKFKPVIMEDGTADYYNIANFEMAEAGQLLVRRFEATPGVNGVDIYGKIKKAKPGKPARRITNGANVLLSEDKTELTAVVSGQILLVDNRLSISQILDINSDVGNATGNIDFSGTVRIHGDLKSDYCVIAEGDVEISGSSAGTLIKAGGNVLTAGGINGANNTTISAKGDVSAKFIFSAEVYAGGDVYADSIIRCKVRSKGLVELQGKRGVVSGGSLIAYEGISASVIGSPMAAVTEICVGVNYEVYEKYLELKAEFDKLLVKYDETDKNIKYMTKLLHKEGLPQEKRRNLMALKAANMYNGESINELKAEIGLCIESLKSNSCNAFVKVTGALHSGVKIQIGNAVMLVREDIYSAVLRNRDGSIEIEYIE